MAVSKATIAEGYPLPAYNYRVTIYDLLAGNPYVIGFSEVSGLITEYEPITYKHGFSFLTGVSILPGMRQPTRVTLKKGMTRSSDFLLKWMDRTYGRPFVPRIKPDVVIDLCDENGVPIISWNARGVLPIKLEAPTFAANTQEVAISQMELMVSDLQVKFLTI